MKVNMRIARGVMGSALAVAMSACGLTEPPSHQASRAPPVSGPPAFAATLATYFPPSEAAGGWRTLAKRPDALTLGMDPAKLDSLGAYVTSLPYQRYSTGITGSNETDKAALVVKNGWLVGEYYNQASARTDVYYLASNGKTFAIMLLGRLQLDYPSLELGRNSLLYDPRWLPEGYPLSDTAKAAITLDQVFRHVSGIVPEAEASVASGATPSEPGWDFVPFTVGQDADGPVSAPLYFAPGDPSSYTKGSTYSSVGFNHFSLIFHNVTGLEPGAYLRAAILDPIGVGRMAYKRRAGMGAYQWATAGNGLASARDFARLAYLLLHEGDWAGRRIFAAEWLRNFTSTPVYPNIQSNQDCSQGAAYPADMYLTTGSGVNRAVVVPSLDLLATINGRSPTSLKETVTAAFLTRLFASVTERYITCDGRVMNDQRVTGLTLINADTDQPIGPLTDGMTLDLAALPTTRLNVRAETAPTPVGSVRFRLDKKANYRTETDSPYALAGDTRGDYTPWTPAAGAHTLGATPYTGPKATGSAGTPLTVRFTVR
jgi:CubicO group peptidase (beta-lactamase class C family)